MKTLVIGASEKEERYSCQAVKLLSEHGHAVVAVGAREGSIGDIPIHTGQPLVADIDTVTLYLGPARQDAIEDYVMALKPRRVIFNPGTENEAFQGKLQDAGIETEEACTLVLLRTGQY